MANNKKEIKELAIDFASCEMNISIPERNGRYAGYKAGYKDGYEAGYNKAKEEYEGLKKIKDNID